MNVLQTYKESEAVVNTMLRLMRETKMARSKITPELLKEARTLRREPFKWALAKIAGALDVANSTLGYNLTKYNERGPWDMARLIVKNVRDRAKAKGIEVSKDFTAENVAEAIGPGHIRGAACGRI